MLTLIQSNQSGPVPFKHNFKFNDLNKCYSYYLKVRLCTYIHAKLSSYSKITLSVPIKEHTLRDLDYSLTYARYSY